ncbi:TonB-dependent receptor [Maricaulis parjimensis]|uniref:TonB-dependent receptor n=1 Tax=Maricaulis parjimensis TaxID=144023 RepID=UPI0019398FCE|nr:TonB-dependent receptor [Maricaulis parjimensis]
MSKILLPVSLAALSLSASPAVLAQATPLTDVITVTGQRAALTQTRSVSPESEPVIAGADTTALIARLPGAASLGNGVLSGQVQYRGLFGSRLNIRINGQSFASGGPNLMDPPLHYAPVPLIERIEVDRGISPVSAGPGLAGGLDAVLKSSRFGEGDDFTLGYDLTLAGHTADESYAAGGLVSLANESWRFHLLGSQEAGSDRETPYGTIGGSEHERRVIGLGGGWQSGRHELALDLRRSETGPTGNPPFAMDIRYFDTDMAQIRYRGDFDTVRLELRAGWNDVDHAMNNYDLRPAPAMMRWRETYAQAETRTFAAALATDAMGGELRFGLDHRAADHSVTITNPANSAFFLTSFPDIGMERTGGFVEWAGALPSGWQGELGLRVDHHTAEAGLAMTGAAVPAMPGMLAMAFNMSDRNWEDDTLDAVARLWRPLNDSTTLRVNLARKTRAPGYVERFAWLPTPASGGLADGNTYVGDIDLEAETAWVGEIGLDWASANAYARPTLFIRRIENYIQGVPFDATPGVINTPVEMVSNMNGDPTPLRFGNVEAELYGLDTDFGYRVDAHWRVDGTLSVVRGERRDINDHLYRVAPPNLRVGVSYDASVWSATLETLATAEQDRVSLSNGEEATPGQVLLNAYARWDIREGVSLSAGIENILDQAWRDHLAGYNRNAGSDIALGERLPGNERSLGLRLSIRG